MLHYTILAATPLKGFSIIDFFKVKNKLGVRIFFFEGGRPIPPPPPPPPFNFSFNFFGGGNFFIWAIYLGLVVVPYHKIVINLPRIYVKLLCKGELYRFSGHFIIILDLNIGQKQNKKLFRCLIIFIFSTLCYNLFIFFIEALCQTKV